MKTILFSFCAICLMINSTALADSRQELFETQVYRDADQAALPYRIMKPERIEKDKTYPLVLFLHGAGERGEDNKKQLVHGAAEFAKAENRSKYPCFFVAPQCPKKNSWVEFNRSRKENTRREEPTEPLRLTLELLDKLVEELPVDRRRIYVTGLSMGGFGTWDAAARRPDFFAAAVPICGGGDPKQAEKLKSLPIWAFHGEADPVVPVGLTTKMIEAIRAAGGKPKMTLYPDVGHNSWSAAYADTELFAWLFSQAKPPAQRSNQTGE